MAYNPYSAINAIYNYKNEWNTADASGDKTKKNKAAENAQVFYKQLRDNGYGDVADQLSAVDVSGAKYILDQYSTKNSGVDNQAYSTSMQSATDKNNKLAGYIDSDRKDVQGKYNDIYNYANQDITKTDEYKSTYNNLMGKYDLSAMQGRNNAVASGGASNGGNIDSYAAANAMRQQAALTAQGQQIAHQAGLDAANARIANVSNILNNLGVYNSSTYDAMNQAIANDAGIGQQYFENAETAKNNEVARLREQASVTGYAPNEWVIKNDAVYSEFLNPDGSFKKEKEAVDIQARINSATDEETKQKLAVVRARKILGNYGEFGQYINEGDISYMKPQRTADYDLTEKKIKSDENISKNETNLALALADKEAALALELAGIDADLTREKLYYNPTDTTPTKPTVDNPPSVKTSDGKPPMTEKQVKTWVDALNNMVSDRYNNGKTNVVYTALEANGVNKYKLGNVPAAYIISQVLGSSDLTEEQAKYLLTEKFGISPDMIYEAMVEPH